MTLVNIFQCEVLLLNNRSGAVTGNERVMCSRTSLDNVTWYPPHGLFDPQGHVSLNLAVAFARKEPVPVTRLKNDKFSDGATG